MPSSREKDQDPDTFIGLAFPLGFANDGIFRKTKTTLEQASNNLKNLLLTMKGERLGHPEFGCEIHNLLFEQIGDDINDTVEEMVKEAVDTWLPYLRIGKTVTEQVDNGLNIDVHFSLKNDLTGFEEVLDVFYNITE
jgi:phage baseplate assembly protein W